jgi:glycosyltransferase involved in cell wall biosynthesis
MFCYGGAAAMTSPSRSNTDDAPALRGGASRRYCLITPCRNEAKFIGRTLETTTAQTVPPARWVIVDDGSTDETPQIIAEYAKRFDYIKVITRKDRGARAVGPGVIEAFYDGVDAINLDDYDYVVKFDGDLEMPPRYFERVIEHMEADPYLGNFSGKLFERKPDGSLFEERTGDENAVGPVKFYRVACFKDIGGFVREVAWDGIDGHICRMNGWIALSKDEPDLRIIHLRPMGSSQQNIWVGRQRWGRGKYFMGSQPYFVAAASVYRMFERPWLIGGVGIAYGYLKAALDRHPRYGNREYRRHLRRYELLSLVLGKGRALDIYNKGIRKRRPHSKSASPAE